MPKVIIIYHTVYGNTAKAAEAIRDGIKETGLEVELRHVNDVKPESVTPFDVIIIGSPTHRGGMSEEMKGLVSGLKKLDLRGKKGGAFDTRYVGEEVGALAAIETSMRELGIDVIVPGSPVGVEGAEGPIAEGELPKCKEFGQAIAGKLK
jgi:flavorubredoxin